MKKNSLIMMMSALLFSFLLVSCGDDNDGIAPILSTSSISSDNTSITLNYSEGLYATADSTGALTNACFSVVLDGGQSVLTGFTVTHSAGSSMVGISLDLSGAPNGEETVTVTPVAGTIFDADGNELDITEGGVFYLVDLGIIGDWKAYDISPVLVSLGYDDSLYAYFHADQTYIVLAYISGIEYELVGTYEQSKSTYGNLWEISLNQATMNGAAYTVTSEGIFEVYAASPDSMYYEVAQTNPAIAGVTAPTAESGFGSTSGGALGTMNIQKYIRIEEK